MEVEINHLFSIMWLANYPHLGVAEIGMNTYIVINMLTILCVLFIILSTGSHHRTSTTQFERSYNLKKIIIHEKYLRSHLRNDIAVLQLEASIDTSLQVNVVCLPKAENRVEPRKRCYITGTHTRVQL